MKKIFLLLLIVITYLLSFSQVKVNGYYKKNGTYVEPHYRSSPDKSPYNNYSYPGNINPYTGKIAGGSEEKYLDRYYSKKYQNYLGGNINFFPSYLAANRLDGNDVFTMDIGYHATTFTPIGGYMIFSFNSISIGTEMGNVPANNYDVYWTAFLGLKGFYAGLGEYQFSNYNGYNYYSNDESEMLYTFGYHSAFRHFSFKIGGMYSPKIRIQGSLGIGYKIF